MRNHYEKRKGEVDQTIIVKIRADADAVALQREGINEIPSGRWMNNGWEIYPLILPPEVYSPSFGVV